MRKVHLIEDSCTANPTVKKPGTIQYDLRLSGDWIIVGLSRKLRVLEPVICVVDTHHPVEVVAWMESAMIQIALEWNYIVMETGMEIS